MNQEPSETSELFPSFWKTLWTDFHFLHGGKCVTFSLSLKYIYVHIHLSYKISRISIQHSTKYIIHLLSLCSLSLIIASSHFCLSSAVLAIQTNHLFLAVL